MSRVQVEINDEGPRRIGMDDMVWLSVDGTGRGMTVAEWLTLASRAQEWRPPDMAAPWGVGGTIT